MNKLGQHTMMATQTPEGKFHVDLPEVDAVLKKRMATAIKSELIEHFSCPAVSGYALTEFEAQLIAGGVIQRLQK